MPLSDKIYRFGRRGEDPESFKGLPGMVADSLPDKFGNTIINEWQKVIGRTAPLNPVEMLCYIGTRGMGALEYQPAMLSLNDEAEKINIHQLSELAALALKNAEKFYAVVRNDNPCLQGLLKVGTSAGGAKSKAIVAYNKKTREFRSGKADAGKGFEHCIVKFDVEEDGVSLSRVEYAYYLMALDCGITMSPCLLYKDGDKAHFVTKRFDRKDDEKLHMQTLAALAHYDYTQPGMYSYNDVFNTIRALNLPYGSREEMFRRMVFNAAVRNQDDHVKNISFLMNKHGSWSLSPAYDITYAYDPAGRFTRHHQLSINGKRSDITRSDLLSVGKEQQVKNPERIIRQIWDVVVQWSRYAARAELDKKAMRKIGRALLPMQGAIESPPNGSLHLLPNGG
jgi:serine/threonine-protein kinase HipA